MVRTCWKLCVRVNGLEQGKAVKARLQADNNWLAVDDALLRQAHAQLHDEYELLQQQQHIWLFQETKQHKRRSKELQDTIEQRDKEVKAA